MNDWRDVVGYEGLYQVSRSGQVRSVARTVPHGRGGTRNLRERILSKTPVVRGKYVSSNLTKDGITRTVLNHRVVLEAWVGPCPAGCEACHNDGDGTNNNVSNLRWGTRSSNARDRITHGTHVSGNAVRVVRSDGIEFDSIRKAAEATGCSDTSIHNVLKGRAGRVGGYGFAYCSD